MSRCRVTYRYHAGVGHTRMPRIYNVLAMFWGLLGRFYARSNNCVDNCNTTIEWKLGNLSGRELSVGVSKFDHGTIFYIQRRE